MTVQETLRSLAARYRKPPAQARLTSQPQEVALWGPPAQDGTRPAVLLRDDGDVELFGPGGSGIRVDQTYQSVVITGKRLKLLFDEIYLYTSPSGGLYLNDEPVRPTRPYTLVVPPTGGVFRIPGNTDLEVAEPVRLQTRLQTASRAVQALSLLEG